MEEKRADERAPVVLVFTYTREEYLAAARYYLFASKTISRRNIVLVGLLLVFALLYGILGGFNTGSVVLLALSALAAGLGCLLYFYVPVRVYKSAEKFRQEYHLEFSDEGVHFVTVSIDSRLGWETYTDAWESKDVFYLVSGPQAYTVVPKRAFAEEGQMEDFRAVLAGRVGAVKRV